MLDSAPARVLVVVDETSHMRALCKTLNGHGYDTCGFTNGKAALAALKGGDFELLIADFAMPKMDGATLLREAHDIDPDLAGIIMTGEGAGPTASEASRSRALDYIRKPFKPGAVLPVLSRALAVRRLRMENAELRSRLLQRMQELAACNKDLDVFSYSISHDLRSPLTAIICMSELMLDAHAAAMPPAAKELVEITLKSARRISELIDDMLEVAQVGAEPLVPSVVDMAALVGEILDQSDANAWQGRVEIRVGELHDAVGDARQLKMVFAALLARSCKGASEHEHPLVEISNRRSAGETIYSVHHNGKELDAKEASGLFAEFRRVRDDEQRDETDVGLSIARSIVRRHGGRIWADSRRGKGTTLRFSLPNRPLEHFVDVDEPTPARRKESEPRQRLR